MGIVCVLVLFALLPFHWKVALGMAYRAYPINLVPLPIFSSIFGPLVIISPHDIVHVVAFVIGTFTLSRLFPTGRGLIASVCAMAAVAGLTELAQHLVYRSIFEWADLRLDMYSIAAVGLALGAYHAVRIILKAQPAARPPALPM